LLPPEDLVHDFLLLLGQVAVQLAVVLASLRHSMVESVEPAP